VFDEKPVDQPRTPGAGLRSVVSGPRRRRARGAPPGAAGAPCALIARRGSCGPRRRRASCESCRGL